MVDLSALSRTQPAVVLAGGRVSRKYRRRLWKRECRNLKAILPKVANKRVSDVEVIEEAVGYIEQLERAIADRLGVMSCPKIVAALHLQHFMKVASQKNNSTTTHQVPVQTSFPSAAAMSQIPSVGLSRESQGLAHISGYSQVGRDRASALRL